jgi:hypothetical protein
VPIIPLLVFPLAYVWEEGTGERAWFLCLLILTIYLCSFGWWTGIAREEGFMIGILQDRSARFILLAQKDELEKPQFRTSAELTKQFSDALKKHDMKKWLQTLDRTSIAKISGFEREVFKTISKNIPPESQEHNPFIESIDPDQGIRLIIPQITIPSSSDALL